MALLEVHNLKTYYMTYRGNVRAVDGVSFGLNSDELIGLVGESGCGKSTVATSILRLLPQGGQIVDGKIVFEGEDLLMKSERELRDIRWQKISMIPQASMNSLDPVIKVGDQIVEAITAHRKVAKKDALKTAEELLELVGIDRSRANNYPFEYSGGMKQRAIIAMAMACGPKVIIADEPTTALDTIVQAKVVNLLIELQRKSGFSMIWITHDLSLVSAICDRICVMYAAKIVEMGDTKSVFSSPRCKYTKLLIESIPNVRETRKLVFLPGSPPDLISPPSGCRFHPRCPYSEKICEKEEPPLVEANKGHYVACHLRIQS